MRKLFVVSAVFALLPLGSLAQANITIDTVPVGDPGNAADTRYATPGYGSVSYTYNIGKYEVTAGQYTVFLNAVAATDTYGLYSREMDYYQYSRGCSIQRSGVVGSYSYSVFPAYANRPVNYVSYWNACRFANWLHNGQPTGPQDASTTERGAYTLDGYNGYDGRTIQRNPGAAWAVTSEDEWYKAAYYKGGPSAGYWDYPTSSDAAPGNDMADASGNNANYDSGSGAFPNTTVVGQFQSSASPYGTFDQGGNVWEWNEAIVNQYPDYVYRGVRGGSWCDNLLAPYLRASVLSGKDPAYRHMTIGFRVSAVPEPSSLLALGSGLLALGGLMRRRR